jgi:hypothetical protein
MKWKMYVLPYYSSGEGKNKIVCVHDMKVYRGSRWKWVIEFTPRIPGTHLLGVWLNPTVGLDVLEKREISCPCQYWNTGSSIL